MDSLTEFSLAVLLSADGSFPLPRWEVLYMHPNLCHHLSCPQCSLLTLHLHHYSFPTLIFLHLEKWSSHSLNIINTFINVIIYITPIIIAQCIFCTFGSPFPYIVFSCYIRLFLLSYLLLVGNPGPLQVQLPLLPYVWNIWTWSLKS